MGPDVLASYKQAWLRLLQCWLMCFSLNCWLSRAEAKPPLGWARGGRVQEQAAGQAMAVMGVTVSHTEKGGAKGFRKCWGKLGTVGSK